MIKNMGSTSFVAGDRKWSISQHLLGKTFGTAYTIRTEELQTGGTRKIHEFNSCDPDCRRAFVLHMRAINDGENTWVKLDMGGGLSDQMYIAGQANPNNNSGKRKQALEMIAALRYGLDSLPGSGISVNRKHGLFFTGRDLVKDYERTGKVPDIKFDPDMPIIPSFSIAGFYNSDMFPDPNDETAVFNEFTPLQKELKRFHDIRQAMLKIYRLEAGDKKKNGAERKNEQETTLAEYIDKKVGANIQNKPADDNSSTLNTLNISASR
jgi:hypothetical protein